MTLCLRFPSPPHQVQDNPDNLTEALVMRRLAVEAGMAAADVMLEDKVRFAQPYRDGVVLSCVSVCSR